MKMMCALAALLAIAGCSGDDDVAQTSQHFQCPDDKPPTDIKAQATYVAIVCHDGSVSTQRVIDYNAAYGGQYTNGQDLTADPFFWMWLMGPSYSHSTVYTRYVSSPAYRSYRPSTYVINNRTIVRSFGGNASSAYAARTSRVSTYQAARSSTSYGSGSSSRSLGSSYSSSSYRSSSFGGRR